MKKWKILSLGGSLVCPKEIDFWFLKNFRNFIFKLVKRGERFVIVVGGGNLARKYQNEARKFSVFKKNLDLIGIYATWLNATLVRSIFEGFAFPKIITNPSKKIKTEKKIIIAGGWKPGRSTDFVSALMAKKFGSKIIVNLSDIDYLYDKDPDKFKDAKPLKKVSFDLLFKIIGKKWKPGANLPFDPIAANLAKREKIKVVILNGKNFKNLENYFKGKNFIGTEIE